MAKFIFFLLGVILFSPVFEISAHAAPVAVQEQGCTACHRFSPNDPQENHKAPDLFYAGNKFNKKWLIEYLRAPFPIRKAGYSSNKDFARKNSEPGKKHSSISRKEAEEMAEILMSLKMDGVETGKLDAEPLSKGQRTRIKILFERNYGCTACHQALNLAGQVRGGVSGPTFINAADRLNPNWIFNWLKSPGTFMAKGRMPVFDLDDETAAKLTKYILTIKKDDAP